LDAIKQALFRVPVIGPAIRAVGRKLLGRENFTSSQAYWEQRYVKGGNSGHGSYGALAEHKAEVLNAFVKERGINSVIEHGCGDGNQLTLAEYPSYLGLDVAPEAVRMCRERFAGDPTKSFCLVGDYDGKPVDLAMSLDVIYHLVEDSVFDAYMRGLFASSKRYVAIYSSDTDQQPAVAPDHVRHRRFTDWVKKNAPSWKLTHTLDNPLAAKDEKEWAVGSFAKFYFYEPAAPASS
jgi:hypothetical protein